MRARSSGVKQKVELNRLPGTDIHYTPGEHLWIVAGCWKVNPATFRADQDIHLDVENLLEISGPGCFVCEQNWSWVIASKPCPGEPRGGGRA